MRCPKCGYNSFDHNLVCPKCRKDLAATRNLLGITVPAPGGIDFFRAADDRAVLAEPVPVVPVPLMEADIFPPDDIAPVDEIEEIEPEEYEGDDDEIIPAEEIDDIEPAPEADDDGEDIAPVEEAEADDDEDINPLPSAAPAESFAQQLADAQAADDEIEIELDDDDIEVEAEPLPVSEDFAAAMTQIKNTLVATGDLTAEDLTDDMAEDVEAIEIEPELVEDAEEPEVVLLDDNEAADDEIDPFEAELMGEEPLNINKADLDGLSDLMTDVDLDDLEKRMNNDN